MYKMESYCLKCKKNTENIDPEISSTSNGRAMILSNCAICGIKKSRFIKNQEAKGLLSQLSIKNTTNIGWYFVLNAYKVNEIVNKFLLGGDLCLKCI